VVVDQVVLVLAVCALGSAALRVGQRLVGGAAGAGAGGTRAGGAGGAVRGGAVLDRLLVATPIAASFAVCWTLALGLAGLAGSVVLLAAGPILAWAAARLLLPGSSPQIASELIERWQRASRTERAAVLALVGVGATSILDVALDPGFNVDALSYHLADVIGWLHSGHAGAVQSFSYDFPVGYYPVTNEILLTWVLGISRSFAPLAVWSTAIAALALAGLWRFVRLLNVPRLAAAASVAAFATLPIFVIGLNFDGPSTDLPAVAWLACAAALSAGARARPALLGPALLAAALGVGTKTTVAPLAVVVLLAGAWSARSRLRPSRWWLAGGAVGGLLVGAPWYVRDTLTHGWPLWPFDSGPTGDPLPHAMSLFNVSFLQRPVATVRTLSNEYLNSLAGGLGPMLGALAVPLVARSKGALIAAAVAIAALLAWAVAPFTGLARLAPLEVLAPTTTRYLLSAVAACVVAVAFAARDAPPLGRRLTIGLLLAASVGSLVSDANSGFPSAPNLFYLLAGAAAGAGAGWLASSVRLPITAGVLRGAALVLAVAFLALSAPGWLWRESEDTGYAHALLGFMMGQPGFISGSQPISFAPAVVAALAGPRLRHPINLIPAGASCPAVQARLRRGWVVVFPGDYAPGITTPWSAANCLLQDHPIYAYEGAVVYGPS
jgi:hypothetical protein